MRSFEFLVLSFEFSPTRPVALGGGGWELKTHNSKLNTWGGHAWWVG
jgi:hypothetical protein